MKKAIGTFVVAILVIILVSAGVKAHVGNREEMTDSVALAKVSEYTSGRVLDLTGYLSDHGFQEDGSSREFFYFRNTKGQQLYIRDCTESDGVIIVGDNDGAMHEYGFSSSDIRSTKDGEISYQTYLVPFIVTSSPGDSSMSDNERVVAIPSEAIAQIVRFVER